MEPQSPLSENNVEEQEVFENNIPLEERQEKWGFTFEELQSAAKVVRILFNNPSLFIGDPYLAETRLYTMITRDRKTKKENRDVYKVIMREEKSRRKKYQRFQDDETVCKTAMKREREEALNMLVQLPGTLICDYSAVDSASLDPSKLQLREVVHEREGVMQTDTQDRTRSFSSQALPSPSSCATNRKVEILRLIGAFENLLRLDNAHNNILPSGYSQASATEPTNEAKSTHSSKTTKESLHETQGTGAHQSNGTDWMAITQFNAQVYRYMPHSFNSQLPPPLFPGKIPPNTSLADSSYYIKGLKVKLAHRAFDLFPSPRTLSYCDSTTPSIGADILVYQPSTKMSDVDYLRGAMTTLTLQLTETDPWLNHLVTFSPEDILTACSEAILYNNMDKLRVLFSSHYDQLKIETSHLTDSFLEDVADASLTLFTARRIYHDTHFIEIGASPVVIDKVPPTSTDQEPDTYSHFDDVQLYATEHQDEESYVLNRWVACYTCKIRYNILHPFYYSLCHLCGEYNYNKRLMARDLRGKNVLLTGCRIKIGYAMAVSLLRCGATLLGTTRFAHEAVARFASEPDYLVWKDRLHLFSLDLRDMWLVTQFCAFVTQRYRKIFAIINNAAQTIARTPEYTAHLRKIEMEPDQDLRSHIASIPFSNEWHHFFLHHTSVTVGQPLTIDYHPHEHPFCPVEDIVTTSSLGSQHDEEEEKRVGNTKTIFSETVQGQPVQSTAITHGTPKEAAHTPETRTLVFDRYDTQTEASDTRSHNSWVAKLAEVNGAEAAEVMAINALSPFIINSRLKPCLTNREGDSTPDEARFIINVSAMEGQFYRYKQVTHPHTNMAKAALNMMTRTSGEDYAQDGIYMNSVDTGWITDEAPKTQKERRKRSVLCPLDEVDAAARCLDLIYTNQTIYGSFLKDFKSIPW